MNPLLEAIVNKGLLFDAAGVIGLGLVGLAALRLAREQQSWGSTIMAAGAIAVLLARLYLVSSPFFMDIELAAKIGPVGNSLAIGLPPLLLTLGLAGIVWGLWSHERWLRVEGR